MTCSALAGASTSPYSDPKDESELDPDGTDINWLTRGQGSRCLESVDDAEGPENAPEDESEAVGYVSFSAVHRDRGFARPQRVLGLGARPQGFATGQENRAFSWDASARIPFDLGFPTPEHTPVCLGGPDLGYRSLLLATPSGDDLGEHSEEVSASALEADATRSDAPLKLTYVATPLSYGFPNTRDNTPVYMNLHSASSHAASHSAGLSQVAGMDSQAPASVTAAMTLHPAAMPQVVHMDSQAPATSHETIGPALQAYFPDLAATTGWGVTPPLTLGELAMSAPPPPYFGGGQFSRGSAGHPFTCARPCKYIKSKHGCKDGDDCDRCHFCRWSRNAEKTKGKGAFDPVP
mmetsp:Transcript_74169/g.206176  ORF Transcript_74169/g.206176 Transcript_74169/m.206176 type:complete len:350 (-) Transcript_74169:66-1115(-)